MNKTVLKKIEEEIELILTDSIYDLVDVEYVKEHSNNFLRIYIEFAENGKYIGLEDCEKVTKLIGEQIDDFIIDKFYMEVSSPGIERKLKKIADYKKFIGKDAQIRVRVKIEGTKKLDCKIINVINNTIIVEVDNRQMEIEHDNISKAKLIYKF